MAGITICWELGAGLGHVRYLAELAKRLKRAGHRVSTVMANVQSADVLMKPLDVPVYQAPRWQKPTHKPKVTLNYAELLGAVGYVVNGGVASMVASWQNLFRLLKPELLIANQAPTALLAARELGCMTAIIGTGFAVPPRSSPMHCMAPWVPHDPARLERSEAFMLKAINSGLIACGLKPLNVFSDLFDCDLQILTTFHELDHYPDRPSAAYRGPMINQSESPRPEWPESTGDRKRVFAYLKRSHEGFEHLMRALGRANTISLAYVSGLSDPELNQWQTSRCRVTNVPVDMQRACAQADLVVCHSGHGSIAQSLLSGTPLLLAPELTNLEQHINTRNVIALGSGAVVSDDFSADDIDGQLISLLQDHSVTDRARDFSAHYDSFDPVTQLENIAAELSALVGH